MPNTMVPSLLQQTTLAEFLALPEIKPANEFIDGVIYQKSMPQGKHSIIQRELTFTIDRPLRDRKIARAFPELRCTFGDRSTVPDIAVINWDRIPRNPDGSVANIFAIHPDWTIEILSPDQGQTKVVKNIMHCLKYGAQMGWLIDPDEQTVFVYQPGKEIEIFDDSDRQLLMPKFAEGVQLRVGELFDWLAE
jgi:Uma2 family endonuclease